MTMGLSNIDDMVEKLLQGGDEDIAEVAQYLALNQKEPEQIMPAIDALSRNPQIWVMDDDGNMEGQNLGQNIPEPSPYIPNNLGQQLGQGAATGAALSEYLANQPAPPKQPIQYASGASVGNAKLATAPTGGLYGAQPGGMPPGLSAHLRGAGNA